MNRAGQGNGKLGRDGRRSCCAVLHTSRTPPRVIDTAAGRRPGPTLDEQKILSFLCEPSLQTAEAVHRLVTSGLLLPNI